MTAISRLGKLEFSGDIRKPKNLSAIEVFGDLLILAADETNEVQILKRHGDSCKVERDVTLNPTAKEIDIEGIAREGNTVYVSGSHSCKRKKLDPEKSYQDNRAALGTVVPEPDRDRLFRFQLSATGQASAIEETSLRPVLDNHQLLQRFRQIPSKENGVDIEGLAVRDGLLYLGFRGPVLRGNWVPVLKCPFAQPVTEAELLFVDLDGRGIRDLARVHNGFLILAGPIGDGSGSHQLYFWDGEDCLPGVRSSGQPGRLERLGEVPADAEARPEGLALLHEGGSTYEVLIVHDGVKNGAPTRFQATKP